MFVSAYMVYMGQVIVSKLTQGDAAYVTFINKIDVTDKSTVRQWVRQVIAVVSSRVSAACDHSSGPGGTSGARFVSPTPARSRVSEPR